MITNYGNSKWILYPVDLSSSSKEYNVIETGEQTKFVHAGSDRGTAND